MSAATDTYPPDEPSTPANYNQTIIRCSLSAYGCLRVVDPRMRSEY